MTKTTILVWIDDMKTEVEAELEIKPDVLSIKAENMVIHVSTDAIMEEEFAFDEEEA